MSKKKKLNVIDYIGKAEYDASGAVIFTVNEKKDKFQHLVDVRGFGHLQNLFKGNTQKACDFQDKIGKFIEEAINEKINRHKCDLNEMLNEINNDNLHQIT